MSYCHAQSKESPGICNLRSSKRNKNLILANMNLKLFIDIIVSFDTSSNQYDITKLRLQG